MWLTGCLKDIRPLAFVAHDFGGVVVKMVRKTSRLPLCETSIKCFRNVWCL